MIWGGAEDIFKLNFFSGNPFCINFFFLQSASQICFPGAGPLNVFPPDFLRPPRSLMVVPIGTECLQYINLIVVHPKE